MSAVSERLAELRRAISAAYVADETATVDALLARTALDREQSQRIGRTAQRLAREARNRPASRAGGCR